MAKGKIKDATDLGASRSAPRDGALAARASERDAKEWIQGWSSVLRAAAHLTDAKSFAAAVGAALASGWELWQPLAESERMGVDGVAAPLPILVARFWPMDGEGRYAARTVALVEGLAALGVDWNRAWADPRRRGAGVSPMQEAAAGRNWAACEAMARRGASWLVGALPAESPLSMILSRGSYEREGEPKLTMERCRAAAWSELEAACAGGRADPEVWMPVAILAELSSREGVYAGAGPPAKEEAAESRVFWSSLFERAARAGCRRWDEPVAFGESDPEWARGLGACMERPTLPLFIAQRALADPEAWEAALSAPGFEVDPRSGRALSSALAWEVSASPDFASRLEWTKNATRQLRRLDPWRGLFLAADKEFELGAAARLAGDSMAPGGWGAPCAALFFAEEDGAHEEGQASGVEFKAQRTLLRRLAELAREIGSWGGGSPGEPGWERFKAEFGSEFARGALGGDKPGLAVAADGKCHRESVLADGPRVGLAAIGELRGVAGEFGRQLALAANRALAEGVEALLPEGKGASEPDFDEEVCVEELCRLAAGLPWEGDLDEAAEAWSAPMAAAYRRALKAGEPEAIARAGAGLSWIEARAIGSAAATARKDPERRARL